MRFAEKSVSAEWEKFFLLVISKALKKNASERYQNIKDVALALKDLRLQMERTSDENKASKF